MLRLTLSVLALSALCAPALADSEHTIRGRHVSDREALIIQQHCDALAAVDNTYDADTQGFPPIDEDTSPSAVSELGMAGLTLSVDLDSITLATCREGGWVS